MQTQTLPIHAELGELQEQLTDHKNVVLIAPPGAGKTTVVPLALLHQPWLNNNKIIMLEPRRLAAKNAAIWMAQQLGESAGQTVGYRMRQDNRISKQTRIEVVTEAVLTRIIQNDPELSEYGCVIFDEFHERHIQADLGLALCLDIQSNLRDDLRLLVMSATLEGEKVSSLLDDAPVIRSEGKSFPVDIHYINLTNNQRIEQGIVQTILTAINEHNGSILVFLPGMREISQVESLLSQVNIDDHISIHPLYGVLSQEDQEKAISPSAENKRKIVLATAIAESSLTIEGITVVIDAGLMRVPRYNPASEMTRLETLPVSKASADQRAGRAGRLAPGTCYRLWSEDKHKSLIAQSPPEITQTDLVPLILELALWGVSAPSDLQWLDLPPAASVSVAQKILVELGALDRSDRITNHGKNILKSGIHPRLGHMILKAKEIEAEALACNIAAILTEKDLFKRGLNQKNSCDLNTRLEILSNRGHNHNVDHSALKRIKNSAELLCKQLNCKKETSTDIQLSGVLLALAYPDRVAKKRSNQHGRYLMANGKAALLFEHDRLTASNYIVVANLDGHNRDARVFLAAEITEEQLRSHCSELIRNETTVNWKNKDSSVIAVEQEKLGALILKENAISSPDPDLIANAMISGISDKGLSQLPWNKTSSSIRERIQFVREYFPDNGWPDLSDSALLATMDEWLKPFIVGKTKLSQIQEKDLSDALFTILDWNKSQELNQLAPTHFKIPSGSNIAIDYSNKESPVLSARIQQLFGLTNTPAIANNKVPLLIHLLSPARRPIQVTKDLVNFWNNTYEEVKKDLKGKYPKHYWPDDPLQAEATNRARPRKK